MPKISIIAAVAQNYAIGKNNNLLWHLPADLRHFKELTIGSVVVMGKRTFQSLPKGALPNRKNVVLTSVLSEGVNNSYFEATSLDDAIDLCEHFENLFIIGGATVYKQCIDKADYMYITWVHHDFEADTFFPQINFKEWEEITRQDFQADDKNIYPYSFVEYKRVIYKHPKTKSD